MLVILHTTAKSYYLLQTLLVSMNDQFLVKCCQ